MTAACFFEASDPPLQEMSSGKPSTWNSRRQMLHAYFRVEDNYSVSTQGTSISQIIKNSYSFIFIKTFQKALITKSLSDNDQEKRVSDIVFVLEYEQVQILKLLVLLVLKIVSHRNFTSAFFPSICVSPQILFTNFSPHSDRVGIVTLRIWHAMDKSIVYIYFIYLYVDIHDRYVTQKVCPFILFIYFIYFIQRFKIVMSRKRYVHLFILSTHSR